MAGRQPMWLSPRLCLLTQSPACALLLQGLQAEKRGTNGSAQL